MLKKFEIAAAAEAVGGAVCGAAAGVGHDR